VFVCVCSGTGGEGLLGPRYFHWTFRPEERKKERDRERVCVCVYALIHLCMCTHTLHLSRHDDNMGWLHLVGSIKLQVFFAEYGLFYRALVQKRPIFLSILVT